VQEPPPPPPPTRAPSRREPPSQVPAPAASAPAEADMEVESVNARAGLEKIQAELEQLREQKQRARQVDREEVRRLAGSCEHFTALYSLCGAR